MPCVVGFGQTKTEDFGMILEVGYKKVTIFSDDGVLMPVREVLTQQRGEIKAVQQFTDLEDLETVEFVFRWWLFRKRMIVDERIKKAVILHLQRYHAKRDMEFDCYAFANLVRGIPSHKVKYMRRYWNTKLLTRRPRGGEVIFLVNMEDTTFYHAAVYLGMGLYISVWGAGGDIEIATLQDMKIGFNAEKVFVSTPH